MTQPDSLIDHHPHWTLPSHIGGLIFDCDGTLADTMPIHYKAWIALLSQHGIHFTEERFYSLGGMPTSKIVRLLADECGIEVIDVDLMVRTKETTFLTLLNQVQAITPVTTIAKAQRGKLPMAVASGGYRRVVELTLRHIGIHDWFDATVCAEDTHRHKPEPDVFIEAARRLRIQPEHCAVFEDTDIGLEAARRAGSLAIDVRPWYGIR
jgi:beta-phosphoglucomutase-like phosphatase (HAD superfamily)